MGFFSKKKEPENTKKEENNIQNTNNTQQQIKDNDLIEGQNLSSQNQTNSPEDSGAVVENKINITDESVQQDKTAQAMLENRQNIQDYQTNQVQVEEEKQYNFKTQNQQKRNNLLDTLLEKGILTKDQIKVAETEASKTGDSVTDVLVRLNFVTDSVIHNIFENRNEDRSKINLMDMYPDMELLNKIPIAFATEHKVIPISADDNKVVIATSNPYDIVLIDQLSIMFGGKQIETIPYAETDLISAVDKFYKGNIIADLSSILSELEVNVDNVKQEDIHKDDTPTVKFVNALLYEAIKSNASDIHIEPDENFVRVRMRIDGVLMNKTIVHKNYWSGICVRVKVLSGMNIAEQRKPQDGGMKMTIQGREIDFRVSSIPTIYGENIVIRILDKTKSLTKLEELGFNNNNLNVLKIALQKPEGIIVVTGPTGSGKTTTLYSILSIINDIEDNIMTLEEPVEYRLPMIRQSEINHRAGFDFASGLRSLLRQDPDIIFLGEIRDKETADIAVRASITGHQVFSTLHTNSALSAITRLIDIGIQPYMLSDSLTAVIAQRLVRKLCPHCKITESMSLEMKRAFLLDENRDFTICRASGCEKCNQTGYQGRIVISEIVFIDSDLRDVISTNPSMKEITATAKRNGFIPMQRDVILKIVKGITSWDEAKRVVDMTEYSKKMTNQ